MTLGQMGSLDVSVSNEIGILITDFELLSLIRLFEIGLSGIAFLND